MFVYGSFFQLSVMFMGKYLEWSIIGPISKLQRK